jgi:hypothetical protein
MELTGGRLMMDAFTWENKKTAKNWVIKDLVTKVMRCAAHNS